MTEFLEMVNIAKAAPFTKEDCHFCEEEDKTEAKNELTAKSDEDVPGENETENDSGELAKNLKNKPPESQGYIPKIEKGEDRPIHDMEFASAAKREWHQWVYDAGLIPVLYGAHHLIPGNAAMAKSLLYENKWLGPVDDGKHKKNIGYNINSEKNGIWLPTSYALRGNWTNKSPEYQKAYAYLAMHDTKLTFHDSHVEYSDQVLKALNNLEKLMKKMKNDGCPICGKGNKEGSPPYHLNARINAVSKWLRDHLELPPEKWKKNIITSTFCTDYKAYLKKLKTKKNANLKLDALRRKKHS